AFDCRTSVTGKPAPRANDTTMSALASAEPSSTAASSRSTSRACAAIAASGGAAVDGDELWIDVARLSGDRRERALEIRGMVVDRHHDADGGRSIRSTIALDGGWRQGPLGA